MANAILRKLERRRKRIRRLYPQDLLQRFREVEEEALPSTPDDQAETVTTTHRIIYDLTGPEDQPIRITFTHVFTNVSQQ